MFDQEYKCPSCKETYLLVVLEDETAEERGENDFCENCDRRGLVPLDREI